MDAEAQTFFALAEALGIGILIGIEREQSEHREGKDASAGVRTFALASLLGAISMMTGGVPLLAVAVAAVATVRIVWVTQQGDPTIGLTTSLTLVAVVLLGALALEAALIAAGVGVVVASLLAAREVLRGFSRTVLTAVELRDGLILAVSALVILPVLPDVNFGPGGALNPRNLFIIVVLVMLIGAAGHVATRVAGARLGLPVSGFLSGFVSSTATISVLGQRASENTDDSRSAGAGATFSSVSSLIQVGIILFIVSSDMFVMGLPVLLGAGLAAGLYGAVIFFLAQRHEVRSSVLELPQQVFSVKGAVGFALVVATTMLVAAILNDYFGSAAIFVTVAIAGLASTNSATFALASLVATGEIAAIDGVLPLAAALSANTVVRIWIALRSGESSFRSTVATGLLVQLAVIWLAWWLGSIAWS